MAISGNMEGAHIYRDHKTGTISKVRGDMELPAKSSVEESVREFLKDNSETLQVKAEKKDLRTIQDLETPVGHVLRFEQQHDGKPVFGSQIAVNIGKDNRVKRADLNRTALDNLHAITTDGAKITSNAAIKTVTESLGDHNLRQGRKPSAKEVYYPTDEGLKPAYEVIALTQDPPHDWQIVIDAYDKAILYKEDLIVKFPDGQALVFDPNPVVTSGDNTLRDPNAAGTCAFSGSNQATIDAERVTRTLRDLTLSGSTYRLEGPFCRIRNFGGPNPNPPEETNANDFNYSSDDDRFEAVNCYYHLN